MLLKTQKHKTSALPIVPVFQLKRKGGTETNHRWERLAPQTHLHHEAAPSPAPPRSRRLRASPAQPTRLPGHSPSYTGANHPAAPTPRGTDSSVACPRSHAEATLPPGGVPACGHLPPTGREAPPCSQRCRRSAGGAAPGTHAERPLRRSSSTAVFSGSRRLQGPSPPEGSRSGETRSNIPRSRDPRRRCQPRALPERRRERPGEEHEPSQVSGKLGPER